MLKVLLNYTVILIAFCHGAAASVCLSLEEDYLAQLTAISEQRTLHTKDMIKVMGLLNERPSGQWQESELSALNGITAKVIERLDKTTASRSTFSLIMNPARLRLPLLVLAKLPKSEAMSAENLQTLLNSCSLYCASHKATRETRKAVFPLYDRYGFEIMDIDPWQEYLQLEFSEKVDYAPAFWLYLMNRDPVFKVMNILVSSEVVLATCLLIAN
jgi:hypothetical protein